ncbi:hypothetical protein E4K10_42090 [Streptomyces sp. T1317-0309]|nr:hypothetical protein E4K10_42090 [Streptomyces sp. T1317-0309]
MRAALRSRMLSAALAAALSALSLSAATTNARADTTPMALSPQVPLDEARASTQAQATQRLFPRTDSGAGLGASGEIGHAWTNFTSAGVDDLNGDTNPGVIAPDDAGFLWPTPEPPPPSAPANRSEPAGRQSGFCPFGGHRVPRPCGAPMASAAA